MSLPRIFAGPRRWRLLALVGNGLCQGTATFGASWALHRLIRDFGAGMDLLPMVILPGAALALFSLRWREGYDGESLGQDYVGRVRERLFGRIMTLPLEPRQQYRYGTTMVRLTGDLTAMKNWVSLGIARLIVSAIYLVATVAAIAWFSLPAAAITASVLGLCILAGLGVTPVLRRRVREARSQRGRLANRLGDRLQAAATLLHFGQARRERKRLRRDGRSLGRLLARRAAGFAALRGLAEFVLPVTLVGLVAFLLWRGDDLVPADMAALAVLLGQAGIAMRHAAVAWEYRLNYDQTRVRLRAVLSLRPLRDRGVATLKEGGPNRIVCSGVRLTSSSPPISLRIDRNDRVLLSGASGAGKSALLMILARLSEPVAGKVSIDGAPIEDYARDSLSRSIRLVSPVLPLVAGTIEDNIRLGAVSGDATSTARVAALCGLGHAADVAGQGLSSRVDGGGGNLPAGLRARVLLARALASSPSVLLIDDPSILVDEEAASALRAAVAERPMTVIAVGDRLHDPIDANRRCHLDADGLTELAVPRREALPTGDNVCPLSLPSTRHDQAL